MLSWSAQKKDLWKLSSVILKEKIKELKLELIHQETISRMGRKRITYHSQDTVKKKDTEVKRSNLKNIRKRIACLNTMIRYKELNNET